MGNKDLHEQKEDATKDQGHIIVVYVLIAVIVTLIGILTC